MNVPEVEPNADQQPDPNTETQDELGALEGHSQQPDEDEVVSQGAQAPAEVKIAPKTTLGRHIKHEEGHKAADRRKAHVKSVRKQREKANFSKKK